MRKPTLQGLWRLADPKVSLASIASLTLAFLVASGEGPLDLSWAGLVVLSTLALEIGKNASGEIFDYDSGTDLAIEPRDRSPFSGGKRVLVECLLTRRQVISVALVGFVLGIGGGLFIATQRSPSVLWIGLIGVAAAFFYHAPPLKLAYRGLGELTVAFVYGPLIATGAFLTLRRSLSPEIIYLAIPLGLLIGAFLWINEFPDYRADRGADKRTLVVRLGRSRAARAYAVIVTAAFLALLMLPSLGVSRGAWAAFVAAVPAAVSAIRLLRHPGNVSEIIPAQKLSLLSFLLYALAAGLGVLLL